MTFPVLRVPSDTHRQELTELTCHLFPSLSVLILTEGTFRTDDLRTVLTNNWITLLKHCSCFLEVCNFHEKQKLLTVLGNNSYISEKLIDEVHVIRNCSFLYSRQYSRIGNFSIVYAALGTMNCYSWMYILAWIA